MDFLFTVLTSPWPWWVAGPLIGLTPVALLLLGNKPFGISSNLRHACAIVVPGRNEFFRYDWRARGAWNLVFAMGIIIGGFLAGVVFRNPNPVAISDATVRELARLGVQQDAGLVPAAVFSWASLLSPGGLVLMVAGGFLVGFGSRWAGGCTSGHGITGLSQLQLPSLVAVVGFFVGGIVAANVLLPFALRLGLGS